MTSSMPAPESPDEIRIIRVYDAPVAMVWDAWTDVDQVSQWWGPRGFTITTRSKDVRPGGSWDYTMHGPDGTDYPNFARYHEVEPRARLVYDHGATSADATPMFRVTATFRDLGGRTELDMRMRLATAEEARQTRVFVKAAGGNGTWDRLAEFLEKEVSSREIFVINRSFAAPIATVFDMWTTPSSLAAWLPTAGFEMAFDRADIRTDGVASFSMSNGGATMFVRHDYLQVRRPDRLAYTQSFTDENGHITRRPGARTWPLTMRDTVLFAEEGASETRVTLRIEIEGAATPEEIATFVGERAVTTLGLTAAFDALEALMTTSSMPHSELSRMQASSTSGVTTSPLP